MIRRHFLAGVVGLKAMCAAAALAVGAGQAEAATYNGTFTLVSAVSEHEEVFGHPYEDDILLPGHWGVATGETVAATITITPDIGGMIFALFAGATEIFNSYVSLSGTGYAGSQSGTEDAYYGWKELFWDGAGSGTVSYSGEMTPWYPEIRGTFTVDLVPVPLPLSAALLPLGIGALAMMRKRRKA